MAEPDRRRVRHRLVDPVTGEEITTPDRPGELRVGGPTVFAGYWGSSPRTRSTSMAACAPATCCDRRHDPSLLRDVVGPATPWAAAESVAPAKLEALIGALPGIAEVAVGDAGRAARRRVAAVVVPAADTEPPTLGLRGGALREAPWIAPEKCPR